jgi:hypothetical protein
LKDGHDGEVVDIGKGNTTRGDFALKLDARIEVSEMRIAAWLQSKSS